MGGKNKMREESFMSFRSSSSRVVRSSVSGPFFKWSMTSMNLSNRIHWCWPSFLRLSVIFVFFSRLDRERENSSRGPRRGYLFVHHKEIPHNLGQQKTSWSFTWPELIKSVRVFLVRKIKLRIFSILKWWDYCTFALKLFQFSPAPRLEKNKWIS